MTELDDDLATDELTDTAWMLQASLGRTARKVQRLRQRTEPEQWPALETVLHQGVADLVRAMEQPDD